MLPALAGKNNGWDAEHRYWQRISKHMMPDGKLPYITHCMEAMALFVIKNNHEKWPYLWQLKVENPGKQVRILPKKRSAKELAEMNKSEEVVVVCQGDHEPLLTPFTDSSAGQAKFGSVTSEGLQFYIDWCKTNLNGRKTPSKRAIEAKVLAKLRKERGIKKDKSFQDWVAHTKKQQPKTSAPSTTVAGLIFDADAEGAYVLEDSDNEVGNDTPNVVAV